MGKGLKRVARDEHGHIAARGVMLYGKKRAALDVDGFGDFCHQGAQHLVQRLGALDDGYERLAAFLYDLRAVLQGLLALLGKHIAEAAHDACDELYLLREKNLVFFLEVQLQCPHQHFHLFAGLIVVELDGQGQHGIDAQRQYFFFFLVQRLGADVGHAVGRFCSYDPAGNGILLVDFLHALGSPVIGAAGYHDFADGVPGAAGRAVGFHELGRVHAQDS